MEVDNEPFFFLRELPPLDTRSEVVRPPEAAALPAPIQACVRWEILPVSMAMRLNVVYKLLVLLRSPWTLLHAELITARRPSHTSLQY